MDAETQARQQLSMLEERRDALSECLGYLPLLHSFLPVTVASLAESFRTDYMDCTRPSFALRAPDTHANTAGLGACVAPSGSTKQSPLVDDVQNTLERSDSRASTSQSHDEVMNAM